MRILLAILLLTLPGIFAPIWAAPNSAEEREIAEKAQRRLYPGGADEQDLKVQEQLPRPHQKIDAKGLQKEVLNALGKTSQEN